MSMYVDSDSAEIGVTIMFSIVIIANLVGNTFVCLVITIYQDMRYIYAMTLKSYLSTL